MPAGLMENDAMFSVREVPWHGQGYVPKKAPKTIAQALQWAKLDWDVIQAPVIVKVDGKTHKVPDYYCNIRSDTMEPLGIVTGRYTPVQNVEAFEFIDNLIGSSMHFETAGSLMNGRRVWVMAKLPDYVEVGGDPIGQYVFISNSHDGKSSVLASLTPIRIVCQNTLSWAVAQAKGKNAQRTYTIRHLGNMSEKIAEARNVLDITINYYEQFKSVGDKLAGVKFSDSKADKVLTQLFPVEQGMGDRAAANKKEARDVVMSLFKGTSYNPQTVGNAPGTGWCLANAIGEYADWGRRVNKDRFQRIIDDPDNLKGRGFGLVLASAGLS